MGLLAVHPAFNQTDEIQAYDAEIQWPGVFNWTFHTNFTPIGRKVPDFPGTIIPSKSKRKPPQRDSGVIEERHQAEVHVKLLMAVE